MKPRKIHRIRPWHPEQRTGLTVCGLETGRVLGVQLGVCATLAREKVTCKKCSRA